APQHNECDLVPLQVACTVSRAWDLYPEPHAGQGGVKHEEREAKDEHHAMSMPAGYGASCSGRSKRHCCPGGNRAPVVTRSTVCCSLPSCAVAVPTFAPAASGALIGSS